MNYQKELNKFFKYKKQNDKILNKIKTAKIQYNNRSFREKNEKKAKSEITRLEKQLTKFFEINKDSYVVYKDSSKEVQLLKIDRHNLENIENHLSSLIKNNNENKKELLKNKYEILFDLLDLKNGDEVMNTLDSLNNSITKNEKTINKLILKKNEQKNQLEEQTNLLNLSLEATIGQLKTEENKELRKELFKEYNKILEEKHKLYKIYKETNIIEYKLTIENDVNLEDVVELEGEEKVELSS
jgi:hypothetical protein